MPAESLAAHIRSLDAGELRAVTRYDGDEWATVFRSGMVEEAYTEEEFEAVTKNLVLKALDDSREQPELARFGHLDASVRWFDEVVLLQVPLDDWSGVLVTFDRDSISNTGRLVDEILGFVNDEFHGQENQDEVEDELAAEFDQ